MEMVSDSFISNPTATDHSRFATILKKTWKRVTSLIRRMKTLVTCHAWQDLAKKFTSITCKKTHWQDLAKHGK